MLPGVVMSGESSRTGLVPNGAKVQSYNILSCLHIFYLVWKPMTVLKQQPAMEIAARQYWDLLVKYLRPQRWRVLSLALLLFGSIGFTLLNPQIVRYFIDTATVPQPPLTVHSLYLGEWPLTADQIHQNLVYAALFFIGAALVQQAVAVGAVYMSENVGWTATNMLRADLARHCLDLDMTFHQLRTPGEMIERIDTDITQLANFFSQFVILIVGNIILVSGVVVLLFYVDARVGLAMAIFALFTLWALARARNLVVPHWVAAREASAQFYGFLEEKLAGTEDIRSSGAEHFVMRNLYELMRNRLFSERKAATMNLTIFAVALVLMTFATAMAFVLGYWLFHAGLATIGTAYIIVNYTSLTFRPLREITNQIQELQKAGAGIGRASELFNMHATIQNGPGESIPSGPLQVEFRDVSFAYHKSDVLLSHFELDLQPGKVLGLLGRTGSGKSTITRLLFRLYDPVEGAVYLGGTNTRQATLTELRQRVGMVTQDVQLFRASVRDNLTFFNRDIPDERILEVLDDLELRDWYDRLPDGLDSELRSGGSGLSAGEAQLLAFTRVFLRDPGLVILDEASSRLDPVTEQRIERAIDKLLRNRTAIIVAHRLATVQRADEILILDHGRIREHGPRRVLAADPSSHYYHLLQTGLETAFA